MSFIDRSKDAVGKAVDGTRSLSHKVWPYAAAGVAILGTLEANTYLNPRAAQAALVEQAEGHKPLFAQKCDMDPTDPGERLVRAVAPELRERPCDPNKSVFELIMD